MFSKGQGAIMRRTMSAVAVILAGMGAAWAAPGPAALILDYSGPPRSGVDAYAEVAAGAEIGLGPRDRLVLLHYASCRQVAVTGGRVSVSELDVAVSDAGQSQDSGRHCPHEVRMDTAAAQSIAPRLDCVMVGNRKGEVAEVEIRGADGTVVWAPAQGFRVIAAPAAPELQAGRTYTLVAKAIRGADIATVAVRADPAQQGKACLLRLP